MTFLVDRKNLLISYKVSIKGDFIRRSSVYFFTGCVEVLKGNNFFYRGGKHLSTVCDTNLIFKVCQHFLLKLDY